MLSALDGLVGEFGEAGSACLAPPPPPSAVPLPLERGRIEVGDGADVGSCPATADKISSGDAISSPAKRGKGTAEGGGGGQLPQDAHNSAPPIAALVLGSGFERLPRLVDELARHFPLAGNNGETIRRVKDPERLAADCAEIGIPHPDIMRQRPADPANWIAKLAGGAGGTHIAPAGAAADESGRYFQRLVRGRSLSALFVADRDRAHIVGFSRQWTSPTPGSPYRYGGAVRLRRYGGATIAAWLTALTRRTGLVGLCSADFIETGNGPVILIEINPRPGATLDIFDCAETPLLEAHIRACRGQAFELPRYAGAMASQIAYAGRQIARFPAIDWPRWTADHQSAGSRIEVGEPICTVFGRGESAAAARRAVRSNLRHLERHWTGSKP